MESWAGAVGGTSELTRAIGANVTHISYRGSAEAMTDMLAGNLDFYCILAISAV